MFTSSSADSVNGSTVTLVVTSLFRNKKAEETSAVQTPGSCAQVLLGGSAHSVWRHHHKPEFRAPTDVDWRAERYETLFFDFVCSAELHFHINPTRWWNIRSFPPNLKGIALSCLLNSSSTSVESVPVHKVKTCHRQELQCGIFSYCYNLSVPQLT